MKIFLLKFSFFIFCLFLVGAAYAQQEAMYSQYMFNGLAINPAYAGSTEVLSASALYRKQWVGVEGAPTTQTFSAHAPVYNNRVGLGFSLINDKIGITNNVAANGIYAFRIVTNRGIFSMGLQTGIGQYRANYSTLKTNPDGIIDQTFQDNQNSLMFNFGTGFYYSTEQFYIGGSVPYLVSKEIARLGNASIYSPSHYRHIFLTSGYVLPLSPSLKLKPSALVKIAEGAPVQVDVNANLWIRDVLSTGLSYRTGDAVVGMVECQISRQLRLGYAYDQPLSDSRRYVGSSHEVMLRFDLVSPKTKYVSPRYF
jgi:type IX secretion system PorP/SprF family membrane protein